MQTNRLAWLSAGAALALGACFRYGRFDVHDLIAIAAGSAAAWLLTLRIPTPAGSPAALRRTPHA